MTDFSSNVFLHPDTWQRFELMCRDLLDLEFPHKHIRAQKNDSIPQYGVDSFKPFPDMVIGLQSKKVDKDPLTMVEIEKEIELAKTFTPKLSKYIIASTLPLKSETLIKLNNLSKKNLEQGLFEIEFWGPNKLKELLNRDIEIYSRYIKIKEVGLPIKFLMDEIFREIKNPSEDLKRFEKIKEQQWSNLDDPEKHKLLTKIAFCLSRIGKNEESDWQIIEAYKYDKTSEKSLSNMALAYNDLWKYSEMVDFANKTLEVNPHNEIAHNLLFLDKVSRQQIPIETAVKEIPQAVLDNGILISINISNSYLERGNHSSASYFINHAQILIKKDPDNPYKVNQLLGEYAIIVTNPQKLSPDTFAEEEFNRLDAIKKELIEIWNKTNDKKENASIIDVCLTISFISYLQQKTEETEHYLSEAIRLNHNHPRVVEMKSKLLSEKEKFPLVIEYLESKLADGLSFESRNILANAYVRNGQLQKATDLLKETVNNGRGNNKIAAIILLLQVLTESEHLEQCDYIVSTIKDDKAFEIPFLVMSHNLEVISKRSNAKNDILKEAKKLANKDSDIWHLAMLAEAFFRAKLYQDAVEVFELFITPGAYNRMIQDYLVSLFKTKPEQAVNYLETLPCQKIDLNAIHMLLSAYLNIGNFEKARKLLATHYDKLDFPHKISYIKLRIREGDVDVYALTKALEEEKLSAYDIEEISLIYKYIGKTNEAIAFLHGHIFNKDSSLRPTARMEALYFTMSISGDFPNSEYIENDTAFIIKDQDEITHEYVIDDNNDNSLNLATIIKSSHPLAQTAWRRKKGETFKYRPNFYNEEREFEIVEVYSKHIYLANKIANTSQTRHPNDNAAIMSFEFNPNKIEDFLEIVKKIDKKHKEAEALFMPYQKAGMVTVENMQMFFKEDIFQSYYKVISSDEMIYMCTDGKDDSPEYSTLAIGAEDIVIDIISLFTLFNLKLVDVLKYFFKKVFITQNSFQALLEKIDSVKTDKSSARMYYDIKTNKPVLYNTDIFKKDLLNTLTDFKIWIDKNCELITSASILKYSEQAYEEKVKLLGKNNADSLIEAIETNRILYADEYVTRKFGNNDKPFKCFYILPLIYQAEEKEIISSEKASEAIITLILSNYKNIPIRFKELGYAFSKNNGTFNALCKRIPNLPIKQLLELTFRLLAVIAHLYPQLLPSNTLIDELLQSYDRKLRLAIVVSVKKALLNKEIITIEDEKMLESVNLYISEFAQ